jgi:peptidoglycan/LPS O-acetylase OafA/YrhL
VSAPSEVARPLGHHAALDGFRGVAVLLVVAYHASSGNVPGGFLGVDVFFVLSGFLITSLLLREHDRTGRIHLGPFYARRARRLLPALVIVLAYVAVAAAVSSGEERDTYIRFIWSTAFYLADLVPAPISPGHSFGHTWSLALEEQFYFVWPLVLIVALRRRRLLVIAAGALAAAVAVAVLRGVLWEQGVNLLWIKPYARADTVLVGCVAGCLYAAGRTKRLGAHAGIVVAANAAFLLMIVAARFAGLEDPNLYHGGYLVFAMLTAFALLATVEAGERGGLAWLHLPPLRYLGRISYGLYLWHPFLMEPFEGPRKLVGLVISVGIAAASFELVERRFLRRKPRPLAAGEPGADARLTHGRPA